MSVTTLDSNTALIVIDLQNGIVAYPTAHPVADVVKRASSLAETFRSHGLPVVLVNVAGGAPGSERLADGGEVIHREWRQGRFAQLVRYGQLIALQQRRYVFINSLGLIADRQEWCSHLMGDGGRNRHRIKQSVPDDGNGDDAQADSNEQDARRIEFESVIAQVINRGEEVSQYSRNAEAQPDTLVGWRVALLQIGDIQAAIDHDDRLQHMQRMQQPGLGIISPKIFIITGDEEIAADQENRQDRGQAVRQINQMPLLLAIRDFRQKMIQAGRQEQDQQIAELDQK